MKNNQINRVIGLVRKTGDRVVVMDQETEEVLVMMRLDEYENLMDFALPGGEDSPMPDFDAWDEEDVSSGEEAAQEEKSAPSRSVATPQPEPAAPVTKLEFNEDWEATGTNASPAEDLSDVPEDEEEPRFYLEAVE